MDIGTNQTVTVLVNSSMYLRAVYTQLRTLNVLSLSPNNNVNVTVAPADINGDTDVVTATDFSRIYVDGTTVTLTAEATAFNGFVFLQWRSSLGPTYLTRTVNIDMDSDINMTAEYIEPFDVTVQSQNPNSGVTIDITPDDISGDNDVITGVGDFIRTYTDGTAISLTAPDTSGAQYFSRWRLNPATFYATRTINLTVNSDMVLTAEYLPPRTISIFSSNPGNGVGMTATTDLNSAPGSFNTVIAGTDREYRDGTSVTIEADLTGPGSTTFQRWQSSLGPTYATRQITITANADETLTAIYVSPWTLAVASDNPNSGVNVTVTPDRNGDGDVVTVAGGVDRVYNNNDSVTLTAELAEGGGSKKVDQRRA